MERTREEIRADLSALLKLDKWSEEDILRFEALSEEYPQETLHDIKVLGMIHEGAYLIEMPNGLVGYVPSA